MPDIPRSISQQIQHAGPSAAGVTGDTKVHLPPTVHLEPQKTTWAQFCYNPKTGAWCGRSCGSWIAIFLYSIMYFIFLATYFLIFLYASLQILINSETFASAKISMFSYKEIGIGLSVNPAGDSSRPLIWYKVGVSEEYDKYVHDLDRLLQRYRSRRKMDYLGPCGKAPYGYGEKPCIIIRINKQLYWKPMPLNYETALKTNAPKQVQNWSKKDKKMWLYCHGFHSYDEEHIKKIRYYPDPPGFDPDLFPMDMSDDHQLVAIQLLEFTMGISLTVQCNLYHEGGNSSTEIMLYVIPNPYARTYINNKNS